MRLLENRNRNVGAMFAAERAADYVAILYCLTGFRRNHELEPLREDVIAACGMAPEEFAPLMNQLLDWGLVESRIEKERLRGYRDTRLNKFRYRITHEAESFIEWLEELQREDLMPEDVDPRGKMDDLLGTLRELERHINVFSGDACTNENARTLCHGLSRLEQVMDELSRSLSELDARAQALEALSGTERELSRLAGDRDAPAGGEKFSKRILTFRGREEQAVSGAEARLLSDEARREARRKEIVRFEKDLARMDATLRDLLRKIDGEVAAHNKEIGRIENSVDNIKGALSVLAAAYAEQSREKTELTERLSRMCEGIAAVDEFVAERCGARDKSALEAFYGIDSGRRDQLLAFATDLGLQLFVASPDQDGVKKEIPLSTSVLVKKDADFNVHLYAAYWKTTPEQHDLFEAQSPEKSAAPGFTAEVMV